MDEIGNSGCYQPPSSVMESPLMQLANASVSVMRANLSPKEIKNSGVESKIDPSTHSTSCSVNTDPPISHLSNSSIDSFTKTPVPIEGTVSSTNNPLPDKMIKKSSNASFIFVGSKNPVLDNISAPQIGNISTQLTRVNSEFITQESDSQKEPKRNLLPIDGTIVNVTKSVGMILTSKPSESMFTTSDMVSTIATKDAVSKRTNVPKEQTLSPPSQINPTSSQTESVPVKTPKLTPCKNEKSISLLPSESIPKTKYATVQNVQSVPLAKKDAKTLVNPSLVTEESRKDTNCSPQIKHVSNAGVTPVSNMCTLPSNTPLILPVTASSKLTEIESHSKPLLPSHTIAQICTTHSILNKHSYLRESQNTSENVKFTSEIIPNNISVNVPTLHTLVPSASPTMPFPAKSNACLSPCNIAVATDISAKKTNQSNPHFSSVNLVSKISSPLSKQLSKSDKKDRVVQAKAGIVESPSKRSSNVVCGSYGEVNTLSASNSSLAHPNLVSVCTVDSAVAFSTPAVNTTSASASAAKCNPDNVTHTLLTSATNSATFSTSVASCTLSVSTCPPIICPHKVTGSLTAASCTTLPSAASCTTLPSAALCLSSLSTDTLPPTTYASVSSINLPLTTPCSSTSMHTSCIATSTHITSNTTSANTIVSTNTSAIASVQSSKNVTHLQEYEIRSNKSDVNNSKNVAKKQPCFQDENLLVNVTKSHTCMSHFIGGQLSGVENSNKQNQYLLTAAIMKPLPSIDTKSEIDSKKHVSEVSSSITMSKEAPASITGTQAPASITGTQAPASITGTEVPASIVETKAPTSIVRTKAPSTIERTEIPSTIERTEIPSTIDKTKAPSTIGETKAPSTIGETKAPSTIGETKAPSTIGDTKVPSTIGETKAPSTIGETKAPSKIGDTKAPSKIGDTKAPSKIGDTKAPSTIGETKTPSTIGETKTPSTIGETKTPSTIEETKTPYKIGETKAPSKIGETKAPSKIGDTKTPSKIGETKAPSTIGDTKAPSTIGDTKTPSTIEETKTPSKIGETKAPSKIGETKAPSKIGETKAPSTIDETKVSSSNLNQFVCLTPNESVVPNIKLSSDKKVIGCKSHSDQLSKNVLTKSEAKMDSSVKQCSSTRITETSDGMTTVSSSLDKSVPCSKQSASVSMIGNAVSVVGDTTKKNLKNKNTSSSVQSVNSDKSELVPLRKKSVKKSKSPGKESKSHHTGSKTSVSSNSALSSVTSKEDPVCSDLHKVSTSHPKLTNVVKDNSTISSNEKKKSSISTVNTAISTKASTPTKTEESSISTRPRRTIKTRHLFSSSSYSTGSIKSDGENSSSNKQRKRTITQSSDEEKKSTSSNNSNKKSHLNKTGTDEESSSPLKKPVRRRSILPAVKSDPADASKNCLLIKTSPNIAQVPSDTPPSTGYTYLLTALSVTPSEKDSGKMVKTPTMASNSGVTSTSPTYSSSKRNVATKCSTTKEEKSSERTVGQTEKTCPDSLISSPRTSISHKSWDTSPVNDTDNTSDESLEGANESDTLIQNSAESRKRKKSTSDVSAASYSPSLKSCDDLSQQIAEAEKFIKKEPIEVTEVDQTVVENNAEATSQNSSVVGAPSRETCEIRKLLNAGCSNTQTPLVQDLISPNSGNNFSQTRPLAPVQLSSPYAIFLPVSLASGATTTVTAPPTSTPLYSIQLNVPNVVRMGKPFLSNDGSITKKHCPTIPATTNSKTDTISSMKSNLISRNNQIATYYPAPLPESLMNKITVNYHACGECGDTFLFKSSLNAHKTRKCMQLTYNCDNCTMKLVFYNKCSVLEHIRSHYPTRPVTIKLDRMEVMPLPEGITDVLEMEDRSKEENSVRDSEEASKFDCTECGAKFHSARPLAEHFGHSEMFCSFTFYCALCQTYLPRHCAQLAHRRLHHEKPPHVCPECGQLIPNLFTFREHLKYKCMHFSRVAPLTCPKCMSKFCYTPELKEHIINVHSETFIKCSICPMAFKASASYQTHHQNTHASEVEQKKEIYKCPLCDTVFHSIQQLMNHVDFHIGELKVGIRYAFRCSMCICLFAKRSQLVSHLSSTHHVDYLQHRCEFCDCVCKTAHNLQTHQRAIHKVELKKYELLKGNKVKGESAAVKSKKMKDGDVTRCSLCHIFFATLAQLQMHTTKVHQRKMDSPPDSGTTSEQSSSSASKNKNSQKFCRYCKAPYKSWSRLMQHILGHRNSGVYICLICTSAAFVSKEELSKHEEFCSGENLQGKPPAVYECEECHQLFKQESWLIAHQKNIHPKKGTLSCDLSGVSNKSNSSPQKKDTQVVNEGKKSFSCFVCKELNKEKIFRCQSQLEKHLMTKHKMSLKQMKIKQFGVDEKNNKNSSCLSQESSDKNNQAALKNVDVVPSKKAKLATPKEETYICAKCNFTNQNFYIFQLHIQEHKTSDDGFQCTTCGLCFAVVDSLRMHLFAVHKIKRSNDSLRDDSGCKSPVSKVIEETDSSPIVQSPVINTPLKVTAPESKTPVAIEPKTVVEPVKIPSDTKSDSNLLTCQCNVCYKMFETEHLLKVHMRTHGMAFIRSKRLTMSE